MLKLVSESAWFFFVVLKWGQKVIKKGDVSTLSAINRPARPLTVEWISVLAGEFMMPFSPCAFMIDKKRVSLVGPPCQCCFTKN